MAGILTTRQFAEWRAYYAVEPWGDTRADLRELAGLAMGAGVDGVTLDWPYWTAPMTADEYRAESQAIQDTIDRIEREKGHHDHSGPHIDPAGRTNG